MTQKIIDTNVLKEYQDSTELMSVSGLVAPPTDNKKLIWNETQQDDYNFIRSSVKKNLPEDWAAADTYMVGKLVTYKLKIWKSLQDTNLGKEPGVETAWWVEVSATDVPFTPVVTLGFHTIPYIADSLPWQGKGTAYLSQNGLLVISGGWDTRNTGRQLNAGEKIGFIDRPAITVNTGRKLLLSIYRVAGAISFETIEYDFDDGYFYLTVNLPNNSQILLNASISLL